MALINDVMIPRWTAAETSSRTAKYSCSSLMLAGDAAQRASRNTSRPRSPGQGRVTEPMGTVVIGTVMGDIHDIGKNIVVTMLKAHGFAPWTSAGTC